VGLEIEEDMLIQAFKCFYHNDIKLAPEGTTEEGLRVFHTYTENPNFKSTEEWFVDLLEKIKKTAFVQMEEFDWYLADDVLVVDGPL
jgi:deoxyhypusine synthase